MAPKIEEEVMRTDWETVFVRSKLCAIVCVEDKHESRVCCLYHVQRFKKTAKHIQQSVRVVPRVAAQAFVIFSNEYAGR